MKIKREHIILACIIILGTAVRIIRFDEPSVFMDSVCFARLGKNLIETGRYVFGENYNMGVFFPPGYPVFIGITNLFIHDPMLSAGLVSLISGCVTIFLAYLIGKELYDEESGLFASLVFAFYPVLIILSVEGFSDSLFFCFLFLSIYMFIIATRKASLSLYILLGILFAIAYLVRPEGVFLFLLPFLHMTGIIGNRPVINKGYVLRILAMLLAFILISSPYMIFIKNYTGKFSLSGKSNNAMILGELGGDRNFHEIINAPDNPYDRAAFTLTEDRTQLSGWNRHENLSFKEYLLKDPKNLARRYLKNVLQQIGLLMKLLLPVFFPLFFCFFNRDLFRYKPRLIFIIFPALYFFMYPLFIIIERQTLIIVLFLILFSCSGFRISRTAIAELANYYGMKRNRAIQFLEQGIKPLIIILLIAGSISYIKYSSFDNIPKPLEHKKAGLYLKETLSPAYEELNIMGRKPYVSFYSESRFTMLPYARSADVVYFAKLNNVDYIVIDERALSRWDVYDELVEMQKYSDDVELFYEDDSEGLIKLFKIKKQQEFP